MVDKVLKVNVRYPNHTVEWSLDGGNTWKKYEEQELPPGEHEIFLRAKYVSHMLVVFCCYAPEEVSSAGI